MTTQKLHAGDPFPALEVLNDAGETVDISRPDGDADWQMIVVYRGRHCPLCTVYLNHLAEFRQQLLDTGVGLVAVSADSLEQLNEHRARLDAVNFPIYHGLSGEQMQTLGLYISIPRSPEETDHNFAEPGLFVINDSGSLQVVDLSNNPFVRPEPKALVSGLAWIRNPDNNYPVRGTYR